MSPRPLKKELSLKLPRHSSPQVLLVPLPMFSTTFSARTHKNISFPTHVTLSTLNFYLWSKPSVVQKKRKAFGHLRMRLLRGWIQLLSHPPLRNDGCTGVRLLIPFHRNPCTSVFFVLARENLSRKRTFVCRCTPYSCNKRKGGTFLAVGETLRRTICALMMTLVAGDARTCLDSLQVGSAVRGVCEAVVHACRRFNSHFKSDSSYGLLQIDFGNLL